MELQEGFWKQWDIEVLNFQLVSGLNVAAVLFLAALYQHFDFAKLVDIAAWSITDIYLFLGPIAATTFSLLLADTSSWLVTYDFGTDNENLVYWTTIWLTALAQIAGNGSTVLVLGIAALTVLVLIGAYTLLFTLAILVLIGASTLLPFIGVSILITLGILILLLVTLFEPLIVNPFAFIISGSYGALNLALLFDSIYMLFTEPGVPIETVADLYEHGPASNMITEWEDTLQDYLENKTNWVVSDFLEGMVEDFWLHLALHALVVLPTALLLSLAKGIFLYLVVEYGQYYLYSISYLGLVLFLIAAAFGLLVVNVDGVVVSFIVIVLLGTQFEDERVSSFTVYFALFDALFRLVSHSFVEVEGLYWGTFYLVKQVERGTSDYYAGTGQEEDSQPEVRLSLEDLASVFSFDGETEAGLEFLEEVTQPAILILMLPLVQVLTWAFQVPFYIELKNHIS